MIENATPLKTEALGEAGHRKGHAQIKKNTQQMHVWIHKT